MWASPALTVVLYPLGVRFHLPTLPNYSTGRRAVCRDGYLPAHLCIQIENECALPAHYWTYADYPFPRNHTLVPGPARSYLPSDCDEDLFASGNSCSGDRKVSL